MPGKLYRRALLLAKRETTYGTDAVPTAAANAVLARNLEFNPLVTEQVDREFIRPYFGHAGQIVAASRADANFELELAGSGAAGTAPKFADLLKIAGLAETVAAGVSVTYSPVTTGIDSATLYYYLDGLIHKCVGARSNLEINLVSKQIPTLKFSTMGLYVAAADAALPNDASYAGWQQPRVVNNLNTPSVSLHGYVGPVQQVTFNFGNQVAHRNMINTESVVISDRKVVGSIMLEAAAIADKDWFAAVNAGTTGALAVTHGVDAGNIVEVDAPNVYLANPRYSNQDGIAMISFDLALATNAGNDEIVLTFK